MTAPTRITLDAITAVGRELGLAQLSVKAVAARLGVTPTALYRHVDGRWGLERLVGESLLAELELRDDPAHDTTRHLLSFGLQLRAFVLAHPGLAAYVQTLFPRGEGGRRLLAVEIDALAARGYAPDAAVVLCSAVASVSIGYAAAEEAQRERAADGGIDSERAEVANALTADARLGQAHRALPDMDSDGYVRLMLTAVIRGIVAEAPPGRPVADIVAALRAAGEGI